MIEPTAPGRAVRVALAFDAEHPDRLHPDRPHPDWPHGPGVTEGLLEELESAA